MWLVDSFTEMIDAMNVECDEDVDNYISEQYMYMLELSAMYTRMSRGRRLISFFQITIFQCILIFHYIYMGKAAMLLINTSLVTFGETLHVWLLIQLVIILIICIQKQHNNIASFHRNMANNFFDYSESYEGINESLLLTIRKEKRFLAIIPILVGIAVVGILVVTPQLDQYGTFDFSNISKNFNQHLPFPYMAYPYQTDHGIGYYASVLLQLLAAAITGGAIGIGGFAYIVMSQNLWMQMKILLDSIKHIEERTELIQLKLFGAKYTHKLSGDKLYGDARYKYCYNICLRKNFRHHQIIMRNFHMWTEIFSVPILLSYLTGAIVIALSLLSLNSWVELPGTTISSLILCACEVGYMYLFSIFSQRLTDLNEMLRFDIYCIKWYLCDEDVKTSLMILQEVTLRPMTLVAGGFIPANMDTFAKVINSAYSYYNLVTAFEL